MDTSHRLRLSYPLEDGDGVRQIELPFVIGVMAGLSGTRLRPAVSDRDFEAVGASSLDRFFRDTRPELTFEVPDVLSGGGRLKIDLKFSGLSDFTPATVAARVEPLMRLGRTAADSGAAFAAQLGLIVGDESFRSLEAAWRGLAFLLVHTTRHADVRVFALDISKRELCKTLKSYRGSAWDQSPIFNRVHRERFGTHGGEPFGCVIGDYYFDHSLPDRQALESLGEIGTAASCPFVTGLAPSLMHAEAWSRPGVGRDLERLFRLPEFSAWRSLREGGRGFDPHSLVLALPRFSATEHSRPTVENVIGASRAEPFAREVWINGAFAVGTAVAGAFGSHGSWRGLGEELGRVLQDLELEVFVAANRRSDLGECGFLALSKQESLGTVAIPTLALPVPGASVGEPGRHVDLARVLLGWRFAQYVKVIMRDKARTFRNQAVTGDADAGCRGLEEFLNRWLSQYVDGDPKNSSETTKAQLPLTEADCTLEPIEGSSDFFAGTLALRLHGWPVAPPTPHLYRRAPRAQIEYDVELYGEVRRVHPPFVLGVMTCLSPSSRDVLPPLAERKFRELDRDNFDSRLKASGARVSFVVSGPDASGPVAVDLTFESMADFSPSGVARRLDATRVLLEARDDLSALLVYYDDCPDADAALRRVMSNPALVPATATLGIGPSAENLAGLVGAFHLHTVEAREAAARGLHHFASAARASGGNEQTPPRLIETTIRQLDDALCGWVNAVMHHPDFQRLERTWLGLQALVQMKTSDKEIKIRVLDVSKEEFYESLWAHEATIFESEPAVSRLRNEFREFGGEPFGCLICDWYVDHGPDDVRFLRAVGEIGQRLHCPWVVGADPNLLQMQSWSELSQPRTLPRIFDQPEYESWRDLRDRDASCYVGLAMPRMLGRHPYEETDPRHDFRFTEDATEYESRAWINPVYAVGAGIARAFETTGWPARICGVETGGTLDWLPRAGLAADPHSAAGAVEVSIADMRGYELDRLGLIPLIGRLNSSRATFFSMRSLRKPGENPDPVARRDAVLAAELPYLLAACRFAQCAAAICRDKIGSRQPAHLQTYLTDWIMSYVDGNPESSTEVVRADHPLALARIEVEADSQRPGEYSVVLEVRPHFQLSGMTRPLRLSLHVEAAQQDEPPSDA